MLMGHLSSLGVIGDEDLRRRFPLRHEDSFHWNVTDDLKRRLFGVAHLIDSAVPDGPGKSLAITRLEQAQSACTAALRYVEPEHL